MAHVERFEDLVVWQKAKVLCFDVYHLFHGNRDFGFKDQIQRASVSVMNNIAEGSDRKGSREFEHFLFIAKGSCAEVRSMLYLTIDFKYSTYKRAEEPIQQTEETSGMLGGLIHSVSHKP